MPSPTTINRRARNTATSSNSSFQTVSLAQTLTPSFLTGQSATAKTTTARPTRQATLGEDTAEESRSLLDLSVNADWDETAAELDDIGAVTDDATVVSDADSGIVTAFTDENRDHQLDLVHVGRTLGYTLWDDGVFSLDRRKEIVSEVIDEVFHLKNSVAKHRPAEEFAAIRSRIARTNREDSVATGAVRVSKGCRVSSAVAAVDCDVRRARCRGVRGSVDLEPVERLMGEVGSAVQEPVDALDSRGIGSDTNFGW